MRQSKHTLKNDEEYISQKEIYRCMAEFNLSPEELARRMKVDIELVNSWLDRTNPKRMELKYVSRFTVACMYKYFDPMVFLKHLIGVLWMFILVSYLYFEYFR